MFAHEYPFLKTKHRLLLGLGLLFAIIVWVVFPVFTGDGTWYYKGDSKLAAQTALQEINKGSSSGLDALGNIGVLSGRVTAVSKEAPPSGGIFLNAKIFT